MGQVADFEKGNNLEGVGSVDLTHAVLTGHVRNTYRSQTNKKGSLAVGAVHGLMHTVWYKMEKRK